MFTLRVVGGLVIVLLLKKLFEKRTDASAKAKNDAATSSATQECVSDSSSLLPSSGKNEAAASSATQECDSSSSSSPLPSSGRNEVAASSATQKCVSDSSSSSSPLPSSGKNEAEASSATQECDSSSSSSPLPSSGKNDAATSSAPQECVSDSSSPLPSSGKNDAAASSATQEYGSSSSSSSLPSSGWDYEVFLSFRGETRTNFTDHLYHALLDIGIRTFRDNEELRIGEKIDGALRSAINQSKIAIVIFSKDYASSKWCLGEVAEIAECMKLERGQRKMRVMPVFYHVDPSVVRNQTPGSSYGNAFQEHKKNIDKDTVEVWKKALKEVGRLKGWDLKNTADG
ncbi:disease resistance protein L6-like [Macadamia integrifolia]|uniref:disease resistance protein L6-like n=1 Tax=Macadamia integrifolia TaxID=60698 RepID=UPI001C4ED649|nr:disease resistance protein L6-like [Macadamia integrifolia]